MRELSVNREVQRREARRAHGLNPLSPSRHPDQLRGQLHEADILQLPVAVDDLATMQDPTTGRFFFQIGYSRIGGPDPIQ